MASPFDRIDQKTYTIQINEAQRILILKMMKAFDLAQLDNSNPGEFGDTEREEAEALIEMTEELPTIEDTHNINHGFCY